MYAFCPSLWKPASPSSSSLSRPPCFSARSPQHPPPTSQGRLSIKTMKFQRQDFSLVGPLPNRQSVSCEALGWLLFPEEDPTLCVLLKPGSVPPHEARVAIADTFHPSCTSTYMSFMSHSPQFNHPHTWSLKEAGLTFMYLHIHFIYVTQPPI